MADRFILGHNISFPIDQKDSGLNSNVAVVGGTGSGKTFSIVMPLLLHTSDHSMVIPVSKASLIDQTAPILKRKGYNVEIIDFAGERSTIGFNPFDYIEGERDCANFARLIVGKDNLSSDPYWENQATLMLSAIEYYVKYYMDPSEANLKSFKSVFDHLTIISNPLADTCTNNMEYWFDEFDKEKPNNYASRIWKKFTNTPLKTAECIVSTAQTGMYKIFSNIEKLSTMKNTISFKKLGEERTVLFVITSSFDYESEFFVNILYTQLLKELMKTAAKSYYGSLEIPVQIIFDDFACGSTIKDFDKQISLFRAAGIGTVILLQSEDQLRSVYGDYAATTILDNCDTYVYFGGNNYGTCRSIAHRCNKDISSILDLPIDNVIVMRRGSKPIIGERYRVFEDEYYRRFIDVGRRDYRG